MAETIQITDATSVDGLAKTINTMRNLPDGSYIDERKNCLSIAETYVLNDNGQRIFNYPEGYQFYAREESEYEGVNYPAGKYIYKKGQWVSDELSDDELEVLSNGCWLEVKPDSFHIHTNSLKETEQASGNYLTRAEAYEMFENVNAVLTPISESDYNKLTDKSGLYLVIPSEID